jgi:hypothetical protein
MQRLRQLIRVAICLVFCGCEGTNFSSVPRAGVRIAINTREGAFVHFQPDYTGSYVIVNKDGYFLNGTYIQAAKALDMFGYGGVLIYVTMFGYVAFDLACPDCAAHGMRKPCEVNGGAVKCPHCGEEYIVYDGSGMPNKGISKEALLRLSVHQSGDVIQISY